MQKESEQEKYYGLSEAMSGLVRPYHDYLIEHNHIRQAEYILQFAHELTVFQDPLLVMQCCLQASHWSDYGTSFIFCTRAISSLLQGPAETVFYQIAESDLNSAKSLIKFSASLSAEAREILVAELSLQVKIDFFNSTIIAAYTLELFYHANGQNLSHREAVVVHQSLGRTELKFNYCNVFDRLVRDDQLVRWALNLASQCDVSHGVDVAFIVCQEPALAAQFFALCEQKSECITEILSLVQLFRRDKHLEIGYFLQRLQALDVAEIVKINQFSGAYPAHIMVLLQLCNADYPYRNIVMCYFESLHHAGRSELAVLFLDSLAILMARDYEYASRESDLTKWAMSRFHDFKSEQKYLEAKTLLGLVQCLMHNHSDAELIMRYLLFSPALDHRAGLIEKVLELRAQPELLRDYLQLSLGKPALYYFIPILSRFYNKNIPLDIERVTLLTQWAKQYPTAALTICRRLMLEQGAFPGELIETIWLAISHFPKLAAAASIRAKGCPEVLGSELVALLRSQKIENASDQDKVLLRLLEEGVEVVATECDSADLLEKLYQESTLVPSELSVLQLLMAIGEYSVVYHFLELYKADRELARSVVAFCVQLQKFKLGDQLLIRLNNPTVAQVPREVMLTWLREMKLENISQFLGQSKTKEIKAIANLPIPEIGINKEVNWQLLYQLLMRHRQQHLKFASSKKSVQLAVAIHLAKIIANMLVATEDVFNVGLISIIQYELITMFDTDSYIAHISHVLDELRHDNDLIALIQSLSLEGQVDPIGIELVRLTLGLSRQTIITAAHAQRAILTALLFLVRQGPVGSCAGTAAAIRYQHDMSSCIRLLGTIIRDGYAPLSTGCNEVKAHYLLKLNSSELNDLVTFDLSAKTYFQDEVVGYLWKAPGLQAVMRYLGLSQDQLQLWVKQTVGQIDECYIMPDKYPSRYACPWWVLLTKLTDNISDCLPTVDLGGSQIWQSISNAFLGETQNPLSRIFEAVLIGGDTRKVEGVRRAMILPFQMCCDMTICVGREGDIFESGRSDATLSDSQGIVNILNLFDLSTRLQRQKAVISALNNIPEQEFSLLRLIELLFEQNQSRNSEVSLSGCVQAFYEALGVSPNEKALTALKLEYVQGVRSGQVINPLVQLLHPKAEKCAIQRVVNSLIGEGGERQLQQLGRFVTDFEAVLNRYLVVAYDHDAKDEARMVLCDGQKSLLFSDPVTTEAKFAAFCHSMVGSVNSEQVEQYRAFIVSDDVQQTIAAWAKFKLDCFPWRFSGGADGELTWAYSAERQDKQDLHSYHFQPFNVKEMLLYLKRLCCMKNLDHDAFRYVAVSMPGHSASLMFGHKSMSAFWRSVQPEQWIKQNMLRPARDIGASRPDMQFVQIMRSKLLGLCAQHQRQRFTTLFDHLPFPATLKDLRHACVNAFVMLYGSQMKAQEMVHKVDSKLMSLLSEDDRAKVTRLHLVDTNWINEAKGQSVHFCVIASPFTDQLEFWSINEDGTDMHKEPEREWVDAKPWRVFTKF